MSTDRRVAQRDDAQDRREGSRLAIVTGPREQLDENTGFYRNIGQMHMALGFSDSHVLGLSRQEQTEGTKVVPDMLLTSLAMKIGPATVIVADLTRESKQVMADLEFARGLGAHAIVITGPQQRLPKTLMDEQIKFDGELISVTMQPTVCSTVMQVAKVLYSFLTSRKKPQLASA